MIPQLRAWYDTYEGAGLSVVGVHSPEFTWEAAHDKVVAATRTLGVRYPVVQDNDHAIWRRYGVRAWPTTALVDRRGALRYWHIGEGDYEATEAMIRRLLAERS